MPPDSKRVVIAYEGDRSNARSSRLREGRLYSDDDKRLPGRCMGDMLRENMCEPGSGLPRHLRSRTRTGGPNRASLGRVRARRGSRSWVPISACAEAGVAVISMGEVAEDMMALSVMDGTVGIMSLAPRASRLAPRASRLAPLHGCYSRLARLGGRPNRRLFSEPPCRRNRRFHAFCRLQRPGAIPAPVVGLRAPRPFRAMRPSHTPSLCHSGRVADPPTAGRTGQRIHPSIRNRRAFGGIRPAPQPNGGIHEKTANDTRRRAGGDGGRRAGGGAGADGGDAS